MTEKPKILIVDDRPENLYTLEKLLKAVEVEVCQATSGFEALQLTLDHDFCVAIVDIQMPEMDGYELVELIRSNEMTATLPVIFVSAIYSDEYHHRKGYEAGAVDFLSKPFVPEILLSKIKVFIDLYQQRKALQQANLALSRLNADKDKFFSIISHDLRGPFNALMGNARLLARPSGKFREQDIQEMSQTIYNQAKVVYNLLDNLLTWSRLQKDGGMQYQPEPIELRGLTEETLAVLEPTANQKEIKLHNMVSGEVWVEADRRMLEMVIRNLAGNALKFTPRGGQVTVAAYKHNGDNQLKVAVQDTGVGIAPEDIAKLFRIDTQHTTQGTEKEKGSGLGLIVCKEMVERNGGHIRVESEGVPGKGTTVEFTVPLAVPPSAQEVVSE